ncbi:DedD protein [Crenobacter luteus]|uniref:SPOR domain-containing protein n=1 Tax=Crenobacter luteus TaxID=1452487 RepID=UPI0010502C6D|nr:SPOR domain-containing protein [Crenobacter luteus]TCP12089.1 DedD protein [Crenobacter luteus]
MAGLSSHEELIMLRKRARRRLVGAVALVLVSTAVLWNVLGHIPNAPMRPEKVEIAGQLASEPAVVPPPAEALASAPAAVVPAPATELVASLPPEPAAAPAAVPRPAAPAPAIASKPAPVPAAPPAAAPPADASPRAVAPPPAKPMPQAEAKPAPKPEAAAKPAPAVKAEPRVEPTPAPRAKDPAAILEGRADVAPAKPAAPRAERPEPAAVEQGKGGNGFAIQLAALSDPAKAEALRSRLAAAGVAAHFSKVTTSKGEVTRVRVGPFASRAEADATLRKLAGAGVTGIVVPR